MSCWENTGFLVHLEGRIYNLDGSRVGPELLDLAARVFQEKTPPVSFLSRWLLATDGDFLLVLANKADGRLAVINDVFAHLPTYYCLQDQRLILSRSLKFITNARGEATFDPMALAQYLLLGFSLGKRSLFTGVDYLEPASLVIVSPEEAAVKVTKLYEFNFENEAHGRLSPVENARNLADLFRKASRLRASDQGPNVVSLSGGLDSRAAAAALNAEGIPLAAASFLDSDRGNAADYEAAGEVARALGVDWRGYRLEPPLGRDILQLLTIKGGLNNLRMSAILPFFRHLQADFGDRLTYFTGDAGSDTVGVSTPHRRVSTVEALARYVIDRNRYFSLEDAANLARVRSRDLLEETVAHLASYPERTLARKYKHFFSLGMATRLYHEGEDRNRHFFWSVTPFYAYDFFDYALNCPDRDKKEFRFYREFLQQLSPALAPIPYADFHASLGSKKLSLLYLLKSITRTRPNYVRRVRKLFGLYSRANPASNALACLSEQSQACSPIGDYLDPGALARVLDRPRDYDKKEIWTLLTVTSIIAYYTCPSPLGEDFLDRNFV